MDPAHGHRAPQGLAPAEEPLPDEATLIRAYHHPVVLIRKLGPPLGLAGLTFVAFLIANQAPDPTQPGPVQALLTVLPLALLFLFILLLLWTAYAVWDWRSHYMELTNRRLIVVESTPFRHETHREIPLGKVQNVTSLLESPLNKQLDFGRLKIDTAGLGEVIFSDVPHPDALRQEILRLQKQILEASVHPREQYRQEVIRNILYGTPAPPPPKGLFGIEPRPRQGYDVFNRLFPFRAQIDGMSITWHRHWWFLLKVELIPLALVAILELVGIASHALFTMLNSPQDPATPVIAVIRPIVWIVALLVALYLWADWRNDYYTVQNDRLLDHDALPLGLFEETKETELRKITDIRFDKPSISAYILHYGDIVARTPGSQTPFTFDGVAHPAQVLREIMNRIEALRERDQLQLSRDMQDLLRSYTAEIQRYQAWQGHQPPFGPV